jgi:dihydroorotate dehydrogenase (NAD+) catalytic subunit
VSLARVVAGIRFTNPILLASGTAGYGREIAGVMTLQRMGGLVTKAVSLEPRAGNRAPRVAEFHGGMLNSVGLANPGVAHVRDDELSW